MKGNERHISLNDFNSKKPKVKYGNYGEAHAINCKGHSAYSWLLLRKKKDPQTQPIHNRKNNVSSMCDVMLALTK